MDFVDLKSQYRRLSGPINERIQAVLDHGQYIQGPEVRELEDSLSRFLGARHCIAVSSGTDALLIALMALGVGRGDEVITTPFSFIATGEVIALLGATPVFVDIDARTYNIDPDLIDGAITPRTKAIMPVSLYGQCADFDTINEVAARREIPVIEDAAQSFGATYKGRKSCTLSDIGATSFFPSKPLGCYGDGGALFTDNDDLATVMREIRVHGQDGRYHHPRLGINGRLDAIQAAILLAKLEAFPEEVEARSRVGERYETLIDSRFDESAANPITTPFVEAYNRSVFAQYTIEIPDRDAVQAQLKTRDIPTAAHYPVPLHRQPAFAFLGQGAGQFPVSEHVAGRVMSLPMHPYLEEDQQLQVVAALKEAVVG